MFSSLLAEVRTCRLCRDAPQARQPLPHEPRPVLQLSAAAPILIAGQAPGARVHASGRPFTDRSGDRLRDWLGLAADVFYDPQKIAIVPMGFCFPGYDAKGGDRPPRAECRKTWHDRLFAARGPFDLKLIIGRYARDYHLPQEIGLPLTDTIARQQGKVIDRDQGVTLTLPHPSWRNTAWLRRNPWFEQAILPQVRDRVRQALDG